jgi:putative FmdB family regulatory protein
MPLYEFYCSECHCIFNFISRRVDTKSRPACPRCKKPRMERKVSLFSLSKGRKESDEETPFPDMDESRMEKVMEEMSREADSMDEEDPRQMGRLMRKLYNASGMELGAGMQEAIQRMESGEDMDQIEADMGDVLENEDPFSAEGAKKGLKKLRNRVLPPNVDDELYEL